MASETIWQNGETTSYNTASCAALTAFAWASPNFAFATLRQNVAYAGNVMCNVRLEFIILIRKSVVVP
jgi:hypothetical protein